MAPSQISFGVDSVNKAGEIAKRLGNEAPLIITDPIVYELGLTRKAEESLHEAGLRAEVFSQVATEPTLAAVESAVETFQSHNCDLLVALGGGSAIDSTKSVSLLLGNEGKLTEHQQQRIGSDWSPARKIERRSAHIIAIPTTAGTGSEVTSGSGVFDPESGIKGWAGNPLLRPTVAICDPALSVSMPPKVTSDTDVDALSQAIECYLVNRFKPISDTLALKAIEVIEKFLLKAFANGQDIEARSAMLWAATTTGLAFSNGGLIHNHTFAEALGDVTHLPHNRLLAITLPHILEYNLIGCEEKLAEIGQALGDQPIGKSKRKAAESAIAKIQQLLVDVENADHLSDYEVSREQLNVVAERVFAQHAARSAVSPRGFRTIDDVMGILQRAYCAET